MLKEVEYRLDHRPADIEEFELLEMQIKKVIIECAIEQRKFSKDAYAYSEAFANAGVTLAPYFEKYNGNPGQVRMALAFFASAYCSDDLAIVSSFS